MKKNAMMRIASVLLVAVLLTTCSISGTFAKYVSEASGEASARVAYWGWGADSTLTIDGLFAETYGERGFAVPQDNHDVSVRSADGNVLAPGTRGEAEFSFRYTEKTPEFEPTFIDAPEVDYYFDVTVDAICDKLIRDNRNIQWALDDGWFGTWDELVDALNELERTADGVYEAGQLPYGFDFDDTHTIRWQWIFDNEDEDPYGSPRPEYEYEVSPPPYSSAPPMTLTQDEYDTYMGNQADLDNVSIKITITATQID